MNINSNAMFFSGYLAFPKTQSSYSRGTSGESGDDYVWGNKLDIGRAGYPAYPISPKTNQNTQADKIPMRWMYPESENNYNKAAMKAALDRQWDGVDDVNNIMWILK